MHCKISQLELNRDFFIFGLAAPFKTLQDLVAHYHQDAGGLPVKLFRPCHKNLSTT